MKKIFIVAIAALMALPCTAQKNYVKYLNFGNSEAVADNTLSKSEAKLGYKLLWDGKSLDGWKGADGKELSGAWTVDDGILIVNKVKEKGHKAQDIVTEKLYKNFILKVDFKLTEGANSGIKYFVNDDNPSIGCEFQILDNDIHPDATKGVGGNRRTSSLYDLIPAPASIWEGFDKTAFHTAVIVVVDSHVEHWLDGVKVLEYERQNQEWDALVAYSKYNTFKGFGNAETGRILLQDHWDQVWFKNLKIKEL